MHSKFRLVLDIVLEADMAPIVIQAARRHYDPEGVENTVGDNGAVRSPTVGESIDELEDALMELAQCNPLFARANVEIERMSCSSAETESKPVLLGPAALKRSEADWAGDDEETSDEDERTTDLEDFETGLYLCRWPNGDFSLIKADNRKDAIVQLDEQAYAESAWLVPLETCIADFHLNDRGEIELDEFGEETEEIISKKCYPELERVLSSDEALRPRGGKLNHEDADKIRRAVEHERTRLRQAQKERTQARTEIGRELQKRLRTVGPVADQYVEFAADQILRAKGREKGKPN